MSETEAPTWDEVVELMRTDVRILGKQPEHAARFLRRYLGTMDALGSQFRRSWGLNSHELHAITTLWEFGRMTMTDLGRRIPLSRAAVTTLTDRLERLELVKRVPDPTDRRRILLEITERVEQEMARIGRSWDARLQEYVEGLDDGVWDTVVDVLADIRRMARDEADVLRSLDSEAIGRMGAEGEDDDPRALREPSRPTWW